MIYITFIRQNKMHPAHHYTFQKSFNSSSVVRFCWLDILGRILHHQQISGLEL